MIVKPNEMTFSDKKFTMIIAGLPGIGKTTLALSAPKPLLIDMDGGISRVEARHRCDCIMAESYESLMSDLKTSDLSAYESIVVDTGGKLLEAMKPSVIAEAPKNGKSDGSLSLQGYGAVKRKFSGFMGYLRSLNKNVIVVFHASEVALSDDVTGLRIRIEGSSRDEVWDDADIGGFMEMRGKRRVIGFSNCERYYAKGTHGIHGEYEVPDLSEGGGNTFIADLFKKMKEDLRAEVEEASRYRDAMASLLPAIENAKDAESLNEAMEAVKNAPTVLTSKAELKAALSSKAKALGLSFDKAKGLYA